MRPRVDRLGRDREDDATECRPRITPIWPARCAGRSRSGERRSRHELGCQRPRPTDPDDDAIPAVRQIARNETRHRRRRGWTDEQETNGDEQVKDERGSGDEQARTQIGELARAEGEQREPAGNPSATRPRRAGCGGWRDLPDDRDGEHLATQARSSGVSHRSVKYREMALQRKASPHAVQFRLLSTPPPHPPPPPLAGRDETTQQRLEWLREVRDEALHAGAQRGEEAPRRRAA